MSKVRVRFAPSPTGFFHIGSARTALFNWLYARHTGGTFVLRIEDTDKERNTPEALRVLLEGMKWLGMNWDEGPEVGGEYGPYFQSERGHIYKEYLQKLLDVGRAYEKDGAIYFKLIGERYTAYDDFKKAEVEKVRTTPTIIEDAVRGRVERAEEQDFVIFRANGEPVFHFVNVVDDIAMGITHVIRGEDHLSNTAKHVELFKAFGADLPVFAHIPLILKSSGQGKMSKRDTGALIEEYEQRQFIPAAVRNYLCLLGWNPKDDSEVMPIDEIIERFTLDGINKGNSRFDEKKLASMNTEYIRQLPPETFAWMAKPILEKAGVLPETVDEDYFHQVLSISQEKAKSLDSLPELVSFFFTEEYSFDPKTGERLAKKGNPKELMAEVKVAFTELQEWEDEQIKVALENLAETKGRKIFDYFPVIRFATSGSGGGPELLPLLRVLGKEKVLSRIDRFCSI